MNDNLETVPTPVLLKEIERRCAVRTPVSRRAIPLWANNAVAAVAQVCGIDFEVLAHGRSRTYSAALARHLVMAALRKIYPDRTLVEIGDLFQQDHGTVMHAVRRINEAAQNEPRAAEMFREVMEALRPPKTPNNGLAHPRG